MNNNPIGIFDSGVGGLSVFKCLYSLLPDEDYIYFGDTYNLPYGDKTKEELIGISKRIFDFFEMKKVKAVVMACNTTSAITYDIFKNSYDYKIYPVVQTMAKKISEMPFKRIGVFATNATINSHAYKNNINSLNHDIDVYEVACPEWVKIVENCQMDTSDSIANIRKHLNEMLIFNPQKVILGCTHYPYLIEILTKFADENLFINPAECVAQFVYNDLKNNNLLSDNKKFGTKFYVSSNPEKFIASSKLFFDVDEAMEINLTEKISK